MRTTPAQLSFSSGEATPQIHGRPDYQRYQTGVALARGWMPLLQGAMTRAPGTLMRGQTRADKKCRMIPFRFEKNDTLWLEFTPLKMRVWRYGALVEKNGDVFELDHPYHSAALTRLRWTQSRDRLYLADGKKPVQELSRFALDDWSINDLKFNFGPFDDINDDETIKVQASAETGTVTLTATGGDVFDTSQIDSLFYLEAETQASVQRWVGNQGISVGDRMRYDDQVYELVEGSTSGVNPPIHSRGEDQVGDGIVWKYICGTSGIVRITAVNDAREATAKVTQHLPPDVVESATFVWAQSAFSNQSGYPKSVLNAGRRLVLANTDQHPNRQWFSKFSRFQNFKPGTLADDAFSYDLDENESSNQILWLARGRKGIHIGAFGETYLAQSLNRGEALGQLNLDYDPTSSFGVEEVPPVVLDGRPIFVARGGQRLVELIYSYEQEGVVPNELSLPAEHLGEPGFLGLTVQTAPHRLIWVRRGNGDLAIFLYNREEKVLGSSTIPLAGGFVEDICVTATEDGSKDVVTLIVKRTVQGKTRRFIEEVAEIFGARPGLPSISEAEHFYCAKTFVSEGTGESSFDMSHLIGKTVDIWTDKGPFPAQQVPASGIVTLSEAVTRAHIGKFDDTHLLRTLPDAAQARDGSPIGRNQQSKAFGARLHQTAGLETRVLARSFGKEDKASSWKSITEQVVPADLNTGYTGVVKVGQPSGWGHEIQREYRPVRGAPATVQNQIPFIEAATG